MADPKKRYACLSYPKGTMYATAGLIQYLTGNNLEWQDPSIGPGTPGGRRRRAYGTRQRSIARAGKPLTLLLDNGETWEARVTGTDLDFLTHVVRKTGNKIVSVYTPRGTVYGAQFTDISA